MIEKERIKYLNNKSIKINREFVVYWMQNCQRAEYNHALEYSIRRANELNKPLIVYLGLTDNYPEANLRHYTFMIEGLKEVKESLTIRNIQMIIMNVSPEKGAIDISKKAVLLITDKAYLKQERNWRKIVADNIDISLVEIETNVIVPIEEVSDKEEYSASTIRKKIHKILEFYTKEFISEIVLFKSTNLNISEKTFNLDDIHKLNIDRTVEPSKYFKGGTKEANKWLNIFIKNKLSDYDSNHSNPSLDYQSNLSPYLHFGQISPLYIYNQIKDIKNNEKFLEELIIRRELSYNFVYYNSNYDNYMCLPKWTKNTLDNHINDIRQYSYNIDILEKFNTHDIYWNAAQKEMVLTGKMHGYMRMYWGKKIIEWTNSPYEAYKTMLYLNNKYSLDGRDPNSFAGIAWCFGKHDRPWKERQIFGTVRFMNSNGLERKYNMKEYVEKINKLSL